MKCEICGNDILNLGNEFNIFPDKKWCNCEFVRNLIKMEKNDMRSEFKKILELK